MEKLSKKNKYNIGAAVAIALAIGLSLYFVGKSNEEKERKVEASKTYQMQVYATDTKLPTDVRFVSGASGVVGDKEEKTLYDAVIDLQKSTPSWAIKLSGKGNNSKITSIKGLKNGKYGKKSAWRVKLNKQDVKTSLLETKIKQKDVIELCYSTK